MVTSFSTCIFTIVPKRGHHTAGGRAYDTAPVSLTTLGPVCGPKIHVKGTNSILISGPGFRTPAHLETPLGHGAKLAGGYSSENLPLERSSCQGEFANVDMQSQ